MDVQIESAEGSALPPGCHISVRLDGVLKQGRYDPNRIFNFQRVECRKNARIDVFQHIGACIVTMDPDTTMLTNEVHVSSTEPAYSGMRLKVNVQSKVGQLKAQRAERASALKNKAREYLSFHGIEGRLSDAVQALLKAQPEDPMEFLIERLQAPFEKHVKAEDAPPSESKALHGQSRRTQNSHWSDFQASPSIVPFTAYYSRHFRNSSLQSALSRFPARSLNGQQPSCSLHGIGKGREEATRVLEEQMKSAAPHAGVKLGHEVDRVRRQARAILLEKAATGTLAKALDDLEGLTPKVSTEQQRFERKATVASALISAAISGELERSLSDVVGNDAQCGFESSTQQTATKCSAPLSTESVPGIDSIRAKALNVLARTFSAPLSTESVPGIDHIRANALNKLRLAANDGRLAQSLTTQLRCGNTIQGQDNAELEEVRKQARSLLHTGCINGTLETVVQNTNEQLGHQP